MPDELLILVEGKVEFFQRRCNVHDVGTTSYECAYWEVSTGSWLVNKILVCSVKNQPGYNEKNGMATFFVV